MSDDVGRGGPRPSFGRILLKISGEALAGGGTTSIDIASVSRIAEEVRDATRLGVQVCAVVGGGNVFRGFAGAAAGMDRSTADHIGMLATVMNALAMQSGLERLGMCVRILSALPMTNVCETYVRRRAMRHMEKGRIVIFAAGTGNPFFTTDTAAALRAVEMNCDALMKGTDVDGIYSEDPKKNENAERYDVLAHEDLLVRNLKVMDAAAVSLARENDMPIVVFSICRAGAFTDVLTGGRARTLVRKSPPPSTPNPAS